MIQGAFKKYHFGIYFFIFMIGFVWGKYFYFGEQSKLSKVFKKNELRLLIHENFLPDDILESFHLEYDTQIVIETYSNDNELFEALKHETFDIVSANTKILENLLKNQKLAKFNATWIKNKANVSADFLSMPLDQDSEYSLPLYWGVTGLLINKSKITEPIDSFKDLNKPAYKEKSNLAYQPFHILFETVNVEKVWATTMDMIRGEELEKSDKRFHFLLPQEGAVLWTESVAILNQSENLKKAHQFVDYLLQKEVALELVKFRQQSVTNKQIEGNQNVEPQFKPSYIRKISISRLKY